MSVLNRVNMRPALVGYTLLTVSWVPPRDIFSTTVLCNTIQFIDNWFWDIFHLCLPSGKKASGHTTTENLQDMNFKPRNSILAWFTLLIFLFIPPDKKMWFNKLYNLLQQLTPLFPRNQALNLTKCHPGKDQATEQLKCYGQFVHISINPPYCWLQTVYQHVNPPEILQGNLSSRLRHIKSLNLVKTQQKNPREYVDFFGMPYLINVKKLTWLCRHVNQNLELSESMLCSFKKIAKGKTMQRLPWSTS